MVRLCRSASPSATSRRWAARSLIHWPISRICSAVARVRSSCWAWLQRLLPGQPGSTEGDRHLAVEFPPGSAGGRIEERSYPPRAPWRSPRQPRTPPVARNGFLTIRELPIWHGLPLPGQRGWRR
jgi:hypothetical protein